MELTVVQEELGEGQQRSHAGGVPAQPCMQALQAGEGAVQEGGVLPAEHVQHQHGLHQALWRPKVRSDGEREPPAAPPAPPGTHSFLQVCVPLPQGSWGRKAVSWSLCQHQDSQTRRRTVFWKLKEWAEG